MGVSGSGKTTISRLLAENLSAEFCDGDDLHPRHNIVRMAAGHALDDAERLPWLRNVGKRLHAARAEEQTLVLACSALKHSYRDLLRNHVADVFFIHLDGPMNVVQERINGRNHEFMPASLLASQYASLEPLRSDERGVRVDVTQTPEQILTRIKAALDEPHSDPASNDAATHDVASPA